MTSCKTRRVRRGGGPHRLARNIAEQQARVKRLEEGIERLQSKARKTPTNKTVLSMAQAELKEEQGLLKTLQRGGTRRGRRTA